MVGVQDDMKMLYLQEDRIKATKKIIIIKKI